MGRLAEEEVIFEALDAILGHRPATKPPLLLDTAAEEMIVASTIIITDAGESEEESEESSVDDGSSSTTTTTTEGDDKLSSQANQKLSTGIRERPPKKTKEEKIESVMKNVVKDVVKAQQRSDEMFLKMEEKRMQYEADQKKAGKRVSTPNDVHDFMVDVVITRHQLPGMCIVLKLILVHMTHMDDTKVMIEPQSQ